MPSQIPNIRDNLQSAFKKYGQTHNYKAGKQLFMKNDHAREIYFLEKGRVRAYLLYPDGSERTLCYVEHGNLVGEEVVAMPARRIVCADAATDITLTSLSIDSLIMAGRQDESVLHELLSLYMQKIELLSNWIFYGQFSHNEARIACFLYDNSEGGKDISYTQDEIAAVTGMSRVSVSQCLKRFEETGILKKGYGSLKVTKRPALKDYFYNQEF